MHFCAAFFCLVFAPACLITSLTTAWPLETPRHPHLPPHWPQAFASSTLPLFGEGISWEACSCFTCHLPSPLPMLLPMGGQDTTTFPLRKAGKTKQKACTHAWCIHHCTVAATAYVPYNLSGTWHLEDRTWRQDLLSLACPLPRLPPAHLSPHTHTFSLSLSAHLAHAHSLSASNCLSDSCIISFFYFCLACPLPSLSPFPMEEGLWEPPCIFGRKGNRQLPLTLPACLHEKSNISISSSSILGGDFLLPATCLETVGGTSLSLLHCMLCTCTLNKTSYPFAL